jgi:hypothetical protein
VRRWDGIRASGSSGGMDIEVTLCVNKSVSKRKDTFNSRLGKGDGAERVIL